MNKFSLFLCLSFLIFSTPLSAQTIKDYKIIIKGNFTDFLLMRRIIPEVELPVFRNTSLTGNMGFHYRDYFYDNMPQTHTNPSDFIFSLKGAFPTKNAIGWNTGLGLRQYFNIHDNSIKHSFIEFKGFYRKTRFNENFRVFYPEGINDLKSSSVEGIQQIKSWYIGLGRTNLFKNKKITIDLSAGIIKNFVDLNTCLEAVSYTHLTLPTTPYV